MTKEKALIKYNETVAEFGEQVEPIERLRQFLSYALTGENWLDVEPFLDAVQPANAEYEQLKADAERWRYWIETASGEAAFELTGITDASNEQINEAIDKARNKK